MKLKRLRSCPQEWWLVSCVHNGGGWTNAVAEFFSATEDGEAKHVHFYCWRDKAVKLYLSFPPAIQAKIRACESVSFEMTLAEANVTIQEALGERPWEVQRSELEKAMCVPGSAPFSWDERFAAEAAAVQNGSWPADVPLPLPKEFR